MVQDQNVTNGYTADKKAKKDALVKAAHSLCLKLKTLARMNNDSVLEQSVDYSVSDLEILSEAELINKSIIISEKAMQYAAQAADFNVTPDTITGLQQAISNYKPLSIQRDSVGDKRSIATAKLKILFSRTVQQLTLINDLVKGLLENEEL